MVTMAPYEACLKTSVSCAWDSNVQGQHVTGTQLLPHVLSHDKYYKLSRLIHSILSGKFLSFNKTTGSQTLISTQTNLPNWKCHARSEIFTFNGDITQYYILFKISHQGLYLPAIEVTNVDRHFEMFSHIIWNTEATLYCRKSPVQWSLQCWAPTMDGQLFNDSFT
jgi:hypothetical protein